MPGHIAGDRGYAGPGGAGKGHHGGPGDEDGDPEWADPDYDVPEWADDPEYGAGPGPPYLGADTPGRGRAR
jgi:hypothetical protein